MSAKTRAATADIRCDSCHKPDLGEVRNDHVNKTVPASRPKSDCITRNPHECGASMAAKRLGFVLETQDTSSVVTIVCVRVTKNFKSRQQIFHHMGRTRRTANKYPPRS